MLLRFFPVSNFIARSQIVGIHMLKTSYTAQTSFIPRTVFTKLYLLKNTIASSFFFFLFFPVVYLFVYSFALHHFDSASNMICQYYCMGRGMVHI